MELEKIRLYNIKQHKDLTCDFKNATTMILGANGSGKSTIVESLFYLFFRELLVANVNQMINEDIISGGEDGTTVKYLDKAFVEGWFSHLGVKYHLISGIAKCNSTLETYNEETQQWVEKSNKINDIYAYLKENIFDGISSDYFINTIYTEQMGILKLVGKTEGERQKEFDKLIGIEQFQTLYECLGKPYTELNKACRNDLVELQNNKKEKQDRIFALKQEQETIKTEILSLKEELAKLEERSLKFKEGIEAADTEYQLVYHDYVGANSNATILTQLEEEAAALQISIDKITSETNFEKEKQELESLVAELHTIYTKITNEATGLNNYWQAKLNELERKLLVIQDDLHSMDIISIHEKTLTENEIEMQNLEATIVSSEPTLNKLEQTKDKYEEEISEYSKKIQLKESEENRLRLEMGLIIKAYENDNFDKTSVESFICGNDDNIELGDGIKCGYCFSVLSKDKIKEKLEDDRNTYNNKEAMANALEGELLTLREELLLVKESAKLNLDDLSQLKNKVNYSRKMLDEKTQKVSKLKTELSIQKSKLKNQVSKTELDSWNIDTKEEIKLIKNNPEWPTIKNYATANHSDLNLCDIKKLMIDIEDYQNKRTLYDNKTKHYQDTVQKFIQIQDTIKNSKAKAQATKDSIFEVLNRYAKKTISELYAYVQAKHETVNRLKIDQGTFQKDLDLNTAMTSSKNQLIAKLNSDIEYLESGVATIDEIIKKDEIVQKKLNILNVAKTYFKQDGLAKHIRKFYIDKLNASMSSYVHLFNFGFLPQIDETAGIVKYWKYSGGQKIAIAILMKIILNFILKNPIKMLILDEPTPYMDTERVEAIRDLIDRIKNILQVIVITHDVEFMNIECNKILM